MVFKKENIPWNKNLTKETSEKIKKASIKQGISKKMFFKNGGKTWNKKEREIKNCLKCNKEYENILNGIKKFCSASCGASYNFKNKKLTKEHINKIIETKIKKYEKEEYINWWLGKHHTEEGKKKISEGNIRTKGVKRFEKKCFICDNIFIIKERQTKHFCSHKCRANYFWSIPEFKEKNKEKRLLHILPIKDTSIEIKMQNELQERGINFNKHKPIINIEHKYQCDIFIEPNIVIECDGNYWHNFPNHNDKDIIRTNEMREKGYIVFRYWESEINNNTEAVVDEIEDYLLQTNNEEVYI